MDPAWQGKRIHRTIHWSVTIMSFHHSLLATPCAAFCRPDLEIDCIVYGTVFPKLSSFLVVYSCCISFDTPDTIVECLQTDTGRIHIHSHKEKCPLWTDLGIRLHTGYRGCVTVLSSFPQQSPVRLQCVRALQGLYQEKDFIGRLELFTSRFKVRDPSGLCSHLI